jgi:hypothetical protein
MSSIVLAGPAEEVFPGTVLQALLKAICRVRKVSYVSRRKINAHDADEIDWG